MKGLMSQSLSSGSSSKVPGTPLEAPGSEVAIPRLSSEAREIKHLRTPQACTACRSKKAKCDGRRPKCQSCQRMGRVCTYTSSKRDHQRMHLQSLQEKTKVYEELLAEVASQASIHGNISIQNVFKKHFEQSPDVFADLLASESLTKHHIPVSCSRISLDHMFFEYVSEDSPFSRPVLKEPPVKVNSIDYWTSLVRNDTASHLLSFYFMWENPTWHLVEQAPFLQDLENRRGKYCSRLLVHVLLFYGCSFSYRLNHVTDRREEKMLGEKLYNEIQRLWEKGKANPDIPTIQSGLLLGLLACTFGLDRLGTQFIMHGARSYSQQRFHSDFYQFSSSENSDEERDLAPEEASQEMISWGIYDVQTIASQVYRKLSLWTSPPPLRCSLKQASRLDEDIQWVSYPFEGPVSRPYYYTTLHFRSALAVIVNELSIFTMNLDGKTMTSDDEDYCWKIYQRLVHWKASLPHPVQPEYNTTPHILCLHFYYHTTVLFVTDLLTSTSKSHVESDGAVEEVDFDLVKSDAMEAIGSLILLFKHRHGWKSVPIVMLHYYCFAGVHGASRLDANDPKWALVLESCVIGLWHMSLGWGRLSKAFLRTIELVLKSNDPDPALIPMKVVAIFKHLNTDLWSATDVASLSADYVVRQVSMRVNPSNTRAANSQTLEDLIRAMENL
ncbi:uncharacterized protein N7515_008989 [Penicillium bovifimosum]|uniref:Zn(2)-C6 fungal-type domain-containing protein n=1 Tax=Penicillium bovifimosum TaxID=126998 RepID=A0A9W9KVE2_9EURO|nr:uncharacterized protein N7515_008989 [Penicillium bovifimosum]KAJ5121028.1 hypothetical protein N7515_008989 [Penicillium bovifimosum]